MKNCIFKIICCFLLSSSIAYSQTNLEIQGSIKVSDVPVDATATSIIVHQTDNTLGQRDISDFNEVPATADTGAILYFDSDWTVLAPGNQGQILTFCDGKPEWTDDGTCPLNVGDIHQGGMIFHIFDVNDPNYVAGETHGYIVSLVDIDSTSWGCPGLPIAGADGQNLGDGYQNTIEIVAGCTTPGIAADTCLNYVHMGFSDWFLPSSGDMLTVFNNLVDTDGDNINLGPNDPNNLLGIRAIEFHTSYEQLANTVRPVSMGNGAVNFGDKSVLLLIRAIRQF